MELRRIDKQLTEDVIVESLEDDYVGRHGDLRRMLRALGDIKGPFSVFLDSKWGDGKTFLVRQLEFVLKMSNEHIDIDVSDEARSKWESVAENFPVEDLYLPVYFNAWENDDFADPLLPLLATMANSCDFVDTKVTGRAKDKIAAIVDSLSGLAGRPVGTGALCREFSGKDLLESYADRLELRSRFDFIAQASISEVANRLVLFIDELDRCRPEFAIKLLEQTKALFDCGEVVLVFSTNVAQLTHVLRGQYGQSFDAEKYLERFYDMRVELTPVDCIRYLKHIGYEADWQHIFTDVSNDFLRLLNPSMRDANRMVDHLKQSREFLAQRTYSNVPSDTPVYIAEGVLLPTFIVMSYEKSELWRTVSRAGDFSGVYDYAKRSETFVKTMDRLINYWRQSQGKLLIDDALRDKLIRQLCALIFINDIQDSRFIEARNEVATNLWTGINTRVIRSLGMEW